MRVPLSREQTQNRIDTPSCMRLCVCSRTERMGARA